MDNKANVVDSGAGVATSTTDQVVQPSSATWNAAEAAGRRAKKDAPVRYSFISRDQLDDPAPPLARILRGGRGGRGGDVRLRLYLSFLWMARDTPTFSFPARAWAELLGLPAAETNGARRIKQAQRWLDEASFIRLESSPGHESVVHLLDDAGTGQSYELPGHAYNRLVRGGQEEQAQQHRYIRLPAKLWTQGWMSVLTGPAVAMLLMLYREARPGSGNAKESVWVSPRAAERHYALSEDTRSKGIRELKAAGLIEVRRGSVFSDSFDYRRVRNVYLLRPEQLATAAYLDRSRGQPQPAEEFDSPTPKPGRRSTP